MTELRIQVLGPLRVIGEGLSEPTRASHRRLLALFATEAGRRIGTERLIDMYWSGDPPTEAKAALQTHVSALRRLLGSDLIQTEGYGYRLDIDGFCLDAVEFTDAASETRRAVADQDWGAAYEAAARALALWRGAPYPELEDDDFARAEIARLRETHIELWELWGEALLGLGRPGEALAELERLVVEHPYRERLWEHLMTARYRMGRHAEALRAYGELGEHLVEMGLEPGPSIRRLEEKILLHHEELSAPPHNLPAELTSFIGRDEELGDIAKLLDEHRLVTLTGVGGSGKTRLAVKSALDDLTLYPDGCWFVNLADLTEWDRIGIEIAGVLGLKPEGEDPLDSVIDSIRHDTMLLILDNCEHLREGAANVTQRLVVSTARPTLVATSREPLGVPGEVVFEVPPLAAPAKDLPMDELRSYDAVTLFVERAALIDGRFRHDDASYALIGSICRLVDGIPLAIELAAAKTRTFDLVEIDQRLKSRLLTLAWGKRAVTPRHETMTAAIGWSYDLLDTTEQRLFANLAVFRGGFDLDMAEQVAAAATDDFLPAFERLVDKSMISRDKTIEGRYRLLEPIREYALDRLDDSGEAVEPRQRLTAWCVDLATQIETSFSSGSVDSTRLERDVENLEAGLEEARRLSDSYAISRIAGVLARHWRNLERYGRNIDLLLTALENIESDDHIGRAEIHSQMAFTYYLSGEGERSMEQATRARELVHGTAPSLAKAQVLRYLAGVQSWLVAADPRGAIPLAREAVDTVEALGDKEVLVTMRSFLGEVLCRAGEVEEGLQVLKRALADVAHPPEPISYPNVYKNLYTALILHPQKRRREPRRLADELLARLPADIWDHPIGEAYAWLTWPLIQTGDWDRAEAILRRLRNELRGEGINLAGCLIRLAIIDRMRGDLDAAAGDLLELEEVGVNPRWYHHYYPLRTDIAADADGLEGARRSTEEYLAVNVDASEAPRKLATLHPLVRAEVNAALASPDGDTDYMARAEAGVAQMRAILDDHPLIGDGSVTMEIHGTHLAFATAELSRVTGPDPQLWRETADRADYIYFRLYAQIRLVEALRQAGDSEEAASLIEDVRPQVTRLGARGLGRLIETIDGSSGGIQRRSEPV